jgi:hypothetical protein
MAEGTYRIYFGDGSTDDVKAESRDQAKNRARTARLQALDPGGRLPALDRNSHPSVRIARVAEHGVDTFLALLVVAGAALAYLLDHLVPLAGAPVQHAGVMQVVGAAGTAIGATLAAISGVTGDSLTMPFFNEAKKAWLLNCWTDVQVAGTVRIRSGKWHDDVNGLRIKTFISDLQPLLPFGVRQPIYSGDTLHVDLAGSAVAGDIEYVCLLLWFEELSAQAANLITYEQFIARAGNYMSSENTIATGTTAAWTGPEAINADNDNFHARSSYALVGYLVDTECAAVSWSGNDTANVRTGGPGTETEREITARWFLHMARATGLPCIPVITADNKAATVVATLQDENGADTVLDSLFCELRPA